MIEDNNFGRPEAAPITATAWHLTQQAAEHLATLSRIVQRLEEVLGPVVLTNPIPAGRAVTDGHLPTREPRETVTSKLTTREKQVLALLLEGLSNRRIARTLKISEPTVKNHLHSIFIKIDVTDRTQAIAKILSLS